MNYSIEKLTHANKKFFIGDSRTQSNFEHIDDFIDDGASVLFFAKNETEVCGVIYGYILARINTEPMLYIHSVDVYEAFQRQGLGTRLVDTMIDYARKRNLYKVFLITNKSNEKAVGLYTKSGGKTPYNDDVLFEWK